MNLCDCGHASASHVNGIGKCYDTWAGDRYECDCQEWEPRNHAAGSTPIWDALLAKHNPTNMATDLLALTDWVLDQPNYGNDL